MFISISDNSAPHILKMMEVARSSSSSSSFVDPVDSNTSAMYSMDSNCLSNSYATKSDSVVGEEEYHRRCCGSGEDVSVLIDGGVFG